MNMKSKFVRMTLVTIFLIVSMGSASAATYTVNESNANFTSIQDAVYAAGNNDTIIVYEGFYEESIVVNRSVTIRSRSNDPSGTIVQMPDSGNFAFWINASNVNISGFTIVNSTIAFGIDHVSFCNIFSNIIDFSNYAHNMAGIMVSESDNITVSNNQIYATYGIMAISPENCSLIDNNITSPILESSPIPALRSMSILSADDREPMQALSQQEALYYGVSGESVPYPVSTEAVEFVHTLEYADPDDRDYNVNVCYSASSDPIFSANTQFCGNEGTGEKMTLFDRIKMEQRPVEEIPMTVDSDPLKALSPSSEEDAVSLSEVSISSYSPLNSLLSSVNSACIFSLEPYSCQVINNTLNGGYCALLDYDSRHGYTLNNSVQDSKYGMVFVHSDDCKVSDNSADSGEAGIYVFSSDDLTFTGNTMFNNTFNLVLEPTYGHSDLYLPVNNTVDGKPVYYLKDVHDRVIDPSSNAGMVYCVDCSNITIRDMCFENNGYGIAFINVSRSLFVNNSISDCNNGMFCVGSFNNTFRDNDLNDNFFLGYESLVSMPTVNRIRTIYYGAGLQFSESQGNIIENNVIEGNNNGIVLGGCINDTFTSNTICNTLESDVVVNNPVSISKSSSPSMYSGPGITMDYCHNCSFTDNNISSNEGCGVNVVYSSNCTFQNNSINSNEHGIIIMYSDDCALQYNTANSNEEYGIAVKSDNCTLQYNTANSNEDYGIGVHYSNNCTLQYNTANSNEEYGIYVYTSNNCMLKHNTANSNEDYGIGVHYSNDCPLQYNTANSNEEYGIYVYTSNNCPLQLDTANSNEEYGIYVYASNNCPLQYNTANSNEEYGIYVYTSNNCPLQYNTANSNEEYGINLFGSDNCTLESNIAADNAYGGIYLYGCVHSVMVNNVVTGHNHSGIFLNLCSMSTLANNTMEDNRYNFGMCGDEAQDVIYLNNTVDGKPIYYFKDESNISLNSSDNVGCAYFYNCSNFSVHDLEIMKNYYGIDLYNCSQADLTNNSVSRCYEGINMIYSSLLTIDSNSADNNQYSGICIECSDNNTIRDNVITSNQMGLELCRSSDNVVHNNTMRYNDFNLLGSGKYVQKSFPTNNTIDGKPVYYLVNVTNRTIGSDINAGVVYCINCTNVTVRDQEFAKNHFGVFLTDSVGCQVYDNRCDGVAVGIHPVSCDNISIYNNVFSNTFSTSIYSYSTSIRAGDSQYINISYNQVTGGWEGISLCESGNCTVFGNVVMSSERGIKVKGNDNTVEDNIVSSCDDAMCIKPGSKYNLIAGNRLHSNECGLEMRQCQNNTVCNNSIYSNSQYGIELRSSTYNNTFYNNYLSNPRNLRACSSYTNIWNITLTNGTNIVGGPHIGGNCWAASNWTGFSQITPDRDGDGICDEVYNASNIVDELPLYMARPQRSFEDDGSPISMGSSGEADDNVGQREMQIQYVGQGSQVSYDFSNPDNPVQSLRFEALTNAGKVAVTVELLNSGSSFASTLPGGKVYRHMDISVGSERYGSSGDIRNAMLRFKVSKEWVREMGIDLDTIRLEHYDGDDWERFGADMIDEDGEYYYFEAGIAGFSPYVITGDEMSTAVEDDAEEVPSPAESSSEVEEDDLEAEDSSLPMLSPAWMIFILLAVAGIVRKQKFE